MQMAIVTYEYANDLLLPMFFYLVQSGI